MLGRSKPRRLDQPIAVSLEQLILQDHFYRYLEATLDRSFVREWTRGCMPTGAAQASKSPGHGYDKFA
jgi:hypothetical protein